MVDPELDHTLRPLLLEHSLHRAPIHQKSLNHDRLAVQYLRDQDLPLDRDPALLVLNQAAMATEPEVFLEVEALAEAQTGPTEIAAFPGVAAGPSVAEVCRARRLWWRS